MCWLLNFILFVQFISISCQKLIQGYRQLPVVGKIFFNWERKWKIDKIQIKMAQISSKWISSNIISIPFIHFSLKSLNFPYYVQWEVYAWSIFVWNYSPFYVFVILLPLNFENTLLNNPNFEDPLTHGPIP